MSASPLQIADFLLKGEHFSKRQEGTSGPATPNCLLKVDEDGFFFLWSFVSQKEINFLECTLIREVTTQVPLKDLKILSGLGDTDNGTSNRVLTICHGLEIGSLSILQFVASTSKQAEKWKSALNSVVHRLEWSFLSPLAVAKKQWKRLYYSVSPKGMIPVRKLVKHFGHVKNEKNVLHKLKSCGFAYSKDDEIDPDEFTFEVYKKIHKKICTREDLDELFAQIAGKRAEHIELYQLVQWLNDNQRDPRLNEILAPPFDEKRASNLISRYESCAKNCKIRRLSKQGFYDYLASDDNCLIYREHFSLCHDMDQPLSHYFINSSHNTYLTGFQWKGKSSVDIYRYALLAGYRCIELDCWDGKGEYHGEPIITHGKAMCTDVVFKNVLVAIRDAAFVTSDYPVILSFETHCSKPLQLKMAKYCEEVFGDLLLGKPMDSFPRPSEHPVLSDKRVKTRFNSHLKDLSLETGLPLPSPNSLKRKILIKNKRLDPEREKAQLENISRNNEDALDDEPEEAHPEFDGSKLHEGLNETPIIPKNDSFVNDDDPTKSRALSPEQLLEPLKTKTSVKKGNILPEEEEIETINYEYQKTSATNIHPYLSSLVNYCQSVKFPGFKRVEEDVSQRRCYHMSSFSESGGLNYIKANAIDFVNYNKCQLSRIYPKGARFDSSNYTPQIFWNAGCQMVSLNIQTYDLGIQLNNEKFNYNGRCGYLLKPDVLLKGSKNFDLFTESTVDGVIAAQCGVKVISSQFLADRPISSYVEVDMVGLPTDTIRKEFRTNMITGNGLNPVYNKETNEFLFRKIICPDLALLRFTLYDENRQLIGQRVAPLSSLQTGYRYVTLRSASGIPLDSTTIFVKISLKSYVPESLLDIASALENPKAHQMSLMKQHAQQLRCLEGDDAEEDEDEDTIEDSVKEPLSNGTLIRNGKEELVRNSKSKSSDKQRVKEQLVSKSSNSSSMQDSVYSKSDEKKAVEVAIEASSVTMEALRNHPTYIKAVEMHRKRCTKNNKKAEKNITNTEKSEERQKTGCCHPLSGLFFGRRRNSKGKYKQADEEVAMALNHEHARTMSPCRRRRALMEALDSIHEETREKLKKSHEKEMNDLTQGQTKRWIENSKMISKDKSIPAAERDRRIRDMKSQDIKNFTEVRQTMKNRHIKQLERLDSVLKEENEKMKKLIETDVEQ